MKTFVDRSFSRKLERTEARVNADFVETRARLDPDSGAAWIEVGGTFAMFDGTESPLTQTFGLGVFEEATSEHLERIEDFYRERGAPVFHEVSPMADPSLLTLLGDRGYRPVELTSVMYRELAAETVVQKPRSPSLLTRVIGPDEVDLWARTSASAWATEDEGLADFMFNFGQISAQCKGSYPYLAELGGRAIATGMLFIYDSVCMLAGASTIPDARNQGAQTALLEDRLSFAASQGCSLAIMGAAPGSQSQRNAQKNGFNIAYTRTKWQLFRGPT
ncbi:MAG: GNAT family N-acetyltransferase [Acidobacteria bacterium]|nr:GNAT family N-acetyltransferase [Acidobacteriota bacterium]